MNNKQLLQKFVQISGSTMVSRVLGVVRELLMVRFIGASPLSDAFFSAFKFPNALRKIFAEGALSAAIVPTIVQTLRNDGKGGVNHLISLAFLVFESIVFILCLIMIWWAPEIVALIVPGFSAEKQACTASLLPILMPFIWFVSSSALLAGPLQAVHHFLVPAFSPVVLNIVFILGIITCLSAGLSIKILCFFIIAGAFVQFLMHLFTYYRLGFQLNSFSKKELYALGGVLLKFIPCALSMSLNEVGLFIVTSFGSFLPDGSISLIYYANRFMGIPQGVFITTLATLLLPYFSRVGTYAPKRLSFYLFEAIKVTWWITLPSLLLLSFFSRAIFITFFLSDKFSYGQAIEAGYILIAFSIGLFFAAINKILLTIYYALHHTWLPAIIALIATTSVIFLSFILINPLGAVGLALALSCSNCIQTVLLFGFLRTLHPFSFYWLQLGRFMWWHTVRVLIVAASFLGAYYMITFAVSQLPTIWSALFLQTMLFWIWVAPLCGLFLYLLWKTKKTELYFLN